ncbi:MAG: TonB-dependent receptor plug domain-containing protein, partial [Saprospiraceae bacterium]|nr:TonB-dependent receptor plug domain-containing protein [Saprospiraceae bacterium]
MKLTCKDIGILLITWLCMSSSVKSQSSKSFVVSEPARLIDVLNELSTDNNILFAYPTLLINEIEIPKSEFKYEEIDDLIHLILNDFDFEVYNVTDSHFLIRKGVEKIASNQVITGSIKDAETGSPLSFATIYVPDYSYGVFSDAEGNFTLEIDNNNYDKFLVSYLGYKQLSVDVSTLMKNPHIRLNQNASIIEDVTIEYLIPPYLISKDGESVTLGKQVISSKTSGIFGNDILRNIQLLSGVSAVSDDMASLRIRGSNAEGSKIILDGIPLYNVSHYYGIFSSINGSFIQKAQLYKNAQPIQYNNTSGGLLILDSGFNNESKNVLDINFLTASIATDNKISDNARFQFAGRTSYRNVNDTKFINFQNNNTSNFSENNTDNQFVANDPLFRFYDLNASIKIRGEKSKISINGFLSNDRLINDYTQDYSIQDFMIGRYIYKNTEEWSNKG